MSAECCSLKHVIHYTIITQVTITFFQCGENVEEAIGVERARGQRGEDMQEAKAEKTRKSPAGRRSARGQLGENVQEANGEKT